MKKVQTIDTEQKGNGREGRLSEGGQQSEEDRPYRKVHKEKGKGEGPEKEEPEAGQALRPLRL